MKCSYRGFGGGRIKIDDDNVYLKFFLIKEKCKMRDIIAIRFQPAAAIHLGCIEIFTRNQPASSYVLFFWSEKRGLVLGQFYQALLKELRQCHQNLGTFNQGMWRWS